MKKTYHMCWETAGKTSLLVIVGSSGMPGGRRVSGERVQEQEKGTDWAEAIFAYTLLLRTLQMKILPGLEHIGVNATWSLGKQSLKYLAIFQP